MTSHGAEAKVSNAQEADFAKFGNGPSWALNDTIGKVDSSPLLIFFASCERLIYIRLNTKFHPTLFCQRIMSDFISAPQFEGYVFQLTERALEPENIVSGKCFLCGCQPTSGGGEHVIPKWLQKRFDLWDDKLVLLNGSFLPYRNLRVPACAKCNGEILSSTEGCVSRLSAADISNWTASDSYEVGRWMAKILLGFLYKEATLLRDRRNPALGTIFPPHAMDEMFLLHLLVQSWRKKIQFRTLHTQHPFTLYVYPLSRDPNYGEFNLSTNIFGKSICMRFGDLGFAFVGDGGLQHEMENLGPYRLARQHLHPIQFDELAARIHYKSTLRDATHRYVNSEDPKTFLFQQTAVVPYSKHKLSDGSDRVFQQWSDEELAKMFERYNVPGFEHLINEAGEASYTRLVDERGQKLSLTG